MSQLLNTLIIPDNTRMEEHFVVVDGDVIIGNYVDFGYGLRANSIVAGERVKIGGGIIADSDIRIDHRANISGDVLAKADVYIGEFARIDGKLTVEGDMDIGKEAKIKDGYIAKGWITVRNPVPVVVLLYIYLLELFKMGKGKEVEEAMDSMFSDTVPTLGDRVMLIPNNARITLDSLDAGQEANVNLGNKCHILGTLKGNTVEVGDDGQIFGSVRAKADVFIGCNTLLHGSIETEGSVHINSGCRILGNITCSALSMHPTVEIEGKLDVENIFTTEEIARPRHFDGSDIISEVTNLVALNAKERSLWASRRRGLRHVRGMRRYGKRNHNVLAYSGSVGDAVLVAPDTVSEGDSEALDNAVNDITQDADSGSNSESDIEENDEQNISEVKVEAETKENGVGEKDSLLKKFESLDDEWSEAETKHKKTLSKSAEDPDNQLDSDEDDDDGEKERKGMDEVS